MKRSKLSPSPSSKSLTPSKSKQHLQQLYFCHFRNGMYMGSVTNFQKQGFGMILHDNGTSMLSQSVKDMLHDYNVSIFSDGAVLSALYNKDRIESILYRNKQFMLFCQYINGKVLDGGAVLIKLHLQQIEYISFRNGVIGAKSVEDSPTVLARVFIQRKYEDVVPQTHLVNLNLEGDVHEEISVCKKPGKILVGYTKQDSMLNGLGFVLLAKGNREGEEEMELLQRGFYKNSQLSGFGQKNFKSGNNYIGQFKYDQFQGSGILKNAQKNNWVSGNFEKGSLVELLTYGSNKNQRSASRVLELIHQNKTSWVDKELVVPCQAKIEGEIEMILRYKGGGEENVLERKRSEVLRKIQDNFVNPESDQEESLEYPDSLKNSRVFQKAVRSQLEQDRNQYNCSYSLIKDNSSDFLSSSRKNPLELSPQNRNSPGDNLHQSSFKFDVKPVPINGIPKQPRNPSYSTPTENKSVSSKSPLAKTPIRQRKTTPVKPSTSSSKSNINPWNKKGNKPTASSVNLIDPIYHRSQRGKLF